VQTGNLRTNPVVWDSNVCHTYWYVYFGQGNVAQNILREMRHLRRHLRRLSAPASSASRFSESSAPRREYRHLGIGARSRRLLGSVATQTTWT